MISEDEMKVYLDNNIIIDIENGRYILPKEYNVEFPYSYVHIEELIESGVRLSELKTIRLNTLSCVSNNEYIFQDNQKLYFIDKSPKEVYNWFSPIIMELKRIIKEKVNKFDLEENLKAKLQIDKNITNNLTISQFIEKYGNIVLGYLDESSDTLQENFQSFFNILNGLGYWSDKKRNGTNINRVYDANHAFYASSCDYFVTNDKKAMMKANFIYSYYGIKTKSISFDEFLNILSSNK